MLTNLAHPELSNAKEYLEKALKVKQQTSSDVAADKSVAATLHEIDRDA